MGRKQARTLWLDAHLPIRLAPWISRTFGVRCRHIGELGLAKSDDGSIFSAARREPAMLLTKDGDFVVIVEHSGPPPHVLWLVCGNISSSKLRTVLSAELRKALRMVDGGAAVVRLGTPPRR